MPPRRVTSTKKRVRPQSEEDEDDLEHHSDDDFHSTPILLQDEEDVRPSRNRRRVISHSQNVVESKGFDDTFREYTDEQWKSFVDIVMNRDVDDQSTETALMDQFKLIYHMFTSHFDDEYAIVRRLRAWFPNPRDLQKSYHVLHKKIFAIHMQMIKRNMIQMKEREGRELNLQLTLTARCMQAAYKTFIGLQILKNAHDPCLTLTLSELTPDFYYSDLDQKSSKKHQKLLLYYFNLLQEEGCMRDKDAVYTPKRNPDGEFVYCYEYKCDIQDFVWNALNPIEANKVWFDCLTEKPATAKHMITTLTNLSTEYFRKIERNSMLLSFTNGLFHFKTNSFYFFKRKEGYKHVSELEQIETNMIAMKYHAMDFREEEMADIIDNELDTKTWILKLLDHFMDLKQIFLDQNFSDWEMIFLFGLVGRLFYPLGELEHWQIFVMFLGLAGTGKSLMLRLIMYCLDKRDVAVLSNTLQPAFALDGYENAKAFFVMDVDHKFSLDQSTFQSMVSGEEVTIVRKFKQPITKIWDAPGAGAGNKFPSWHNNAGSLARRLVIIEFMRTIVESKPDLFQICTRKIDYFVKIVNTCYLHLVNKYKHVNIKEVLPEKFKKSEKRALNELNALEQFIQNCCELKSHPDVNVCPEIAVSFDDFVTYFKKYCTQQSLRAPPMTYTYYAGVIAKNNVQRIDATERLYPKWDQAFNCVYLTNIRIKHDMISTLDSIVVSKR